MVTMPCQIDYSVWSFVHGFYPIFGRLRLAVVADWMPFRTITVQRLQGLYLVLVLVGRRWSCLAFLSFVRPLPQPTKSQPTVISVVLGVLLAVLLAQPLLYRLFMRPTEECWQPSTFWTLVAHRMRGIFGTVVTLVVLLACTDDFRETLTILGTNNGIDNQTALRFKQKLAQHFREQLIDEVDKALAAHSGFTDEDLDFIINYDIKYRMGQDEAEGE